MATVKYADPVVRRRLLVSAAVAVAAVLLSAHEYSAQSLSYTSGQPVSPAFEGWETAPDGTSSFIFGYMNNNWEEEIDVPVGPDNGFNVLGVDLGQPTRFLPRRNRFVFRVKVPKDFGTKELVWTLKTNGVTEKAYATLRQDYFLDSVTVASETGALGAGSSNPTMRANKAPAIQLDGAKTRSVKVGQPLELTAIVTDDGIPKGAVIGQGPQQPTPTQLARRAQMPPVRLTVGKWLGLHLSWFVYRGPGKVTFDPLQVKVWEDTRAGANSPWAPVWTAPPVPEGGKHIVNAVFDTPGTYVLRARADDGALLDDQELTVTVTQ
jgi:hypothetical protein